MKLILKSVAVTKKIFNQLEISSLKDIANGHPVGWVNPGGRLRYILIYHTDTSRLTKYPLFSHVEFDLKQIKVVIGIGFTPYYYPLSPEKPIKEINDLVRNIRLIKTIAEDIGQIFL